MRFFGETHIEFAGSRNKAFILSGIFILAGLISLAIQGGPELSIDFTGGTLIQVKFDEEVPIRELRDVVARAGYSAGEIQSFGQPNEYLIKIQEVKEATFAAERLRNSLNRVAPHGKWRVSSVRELPPDYTQQFEGGNLIVMETDSIPALEKLKDDLREEGVSVVEATKEASGRIAFRLPFLGAESKAADKLKQTLADAFPQRKIEMRRTETVGPKIGEELKNRAMAAIVISLFGILVYISWRFEFKFAIGAIAALVHDVIITVGIFSILGKEISLTIIAALLTIVGYSLNDTIVVFDRIRENFSLRRQQAYQNMINISINESLSRTIVTSLTTLIVVLFLYFMGGEVIHDFAFALMVGIVVGTYSSIYVASPVLIEWENRFSSRTKVKKRKRKI
jgi:preprotein translocase subunit SecF